MKSMKSFPIHILAKAKGVHIKSWPNFYITPDACLKKLLSWLITGMLGNEGLFTRFLKATPTEALQGLLRLRVTGVAPL